MFLTVRGLVLRVCPYNDSDAMLTILTAEYGRISAKVRGLRRKNSPLSAACQLLAYGEFILFSYKDNYTINEATSIELFTQLRRDLQKLSLGTYFAQVSEVVAQEDMPNPELLSLTLNCLYGLSSLNLSEEKVKSVFELRTACLSGYMPDLSSCHICAEPSPSYFDLSQGILECHRCRDYSSKGIRMPISISVLDALRYICHCDIKKIFSFDLPINAMTELSDISGAYLSTQLERGFSSLDFYKSLVYQSN